MDKKVLIKTEKLCKTFSNNGVMQHVLSNIDLEIYEGDFTVIMWPSGAGKSTLLYALSGMDKPTLGNIYFNDLNITELNQDDLSLFRRKNCGFVFQQIYLVDSMSIMDNILSSGLLVKKNKKEVIANAYDLLEKVNIKKEYAKKFPTQISGGEARTCWNCKSFNK